MTDLKQVRATLRDALSAAGLEAFSTVPEKVTPPFVYVAPAEPYLTPEGASFGGLIARHQVTVVASPGVNEDTADELDDLVQQVVLVIEPLVGTYEVGRPGAISISGQGQFLAAPIDISDEIRLGEE